jgi:ABC-2 type transport system ATP-binding protein
LTELLKVAHLNKKSKGTPVLNDLDFQLNDHEIVGLLGPSGAGMPLVIAAILGLTDYEEGEISLIGRPVKKDSERTLRPLGAVLPDLPHYPYLSGWGNLKQAVRLKKVHLKKKDLQKLAASVGLKNVMNRKVRTFSAAQQFQLSLAEALLGAPKVLIIDQALDQLDFAAQKEIESLLNAQKEQGTGILLLSQNIPLVARLADRVIVMQKGTIAAKRNLKEEDPERRIRLKTTDDARAVKVLYENHYDKVLALDHGIEVTMISSERPEIVQLLLDEGIGVWEIEQVETSLEEKLAGWFQGGTEEWAD